MQGVRETWLRPVLYMGGMWLEVAFWCIYWQCMDQTTGVQNQLVTAFLLAIEVI